MSHLFVANQGHPQIHPDYQRRASYNESGCEPQKMEHRRPQSYEVILTYPHGAEGLRRKSEPTTPDRSEGLRRKCEECEDSQYGSPGHTATPASFGSSCFASESQEVFEDSQFDD